MPPGTCSFPDSLPRRARNGGYSEVFTNLLITTLAVAAVNVPRAPTFAPQFKPPAAQVITVTNLLTNTLAPAGVVAAPFVPEDFPNPLVPKRVQSDSSVNLLGTTLAPVVPAILPFNATDWQNPTARGSRATQVIDAPNLLNTTLVPVVVTPAPFVNSDWPNPLVRKSPQYSDLNNTLPLRSVTPKPFKQDDWQNPTPRGSRAHLQWTHQYNPALIPTTVAFPLHTPTFVSQTRKAQAAQVIAAPNLLTSTLTPAVAGPAPFRQSEWSNPVILAQAWTRAQTGEGVNLLTTTLTPSVGGTEFSGVTKLLYSGISLPQYLARDVSYHDVVSSIAVP